MIFVAFRKKEFRENKGKMHVNFHDDVSELKETYDDYKNGGCWPYEISDKDAAEAYWDEIPNEAMEILEKGKPCFVTFWGDNEEIHEEEPHYSEVLREIFDRDDRVTYWTCSEDVLEMESELVEYLHNKNDSSAWFMRRELESRGLYVHEDSRAFLTKQEYEELCEGEDND